MTGNLAICSNLPGNLDQLHRTEAKARARSQTKRQQIREATELRQLAYEAAKVMRESASQSEEGFTRDDAVAVSALLRGWDTMRSAIRELRGIPLSGSRRPAPDLPKTRKSRPANRPPSAPKLQGAPSPSPMNQPVSPNLTDGRNLPTTNDPKP
jgi:hypothetical protein